MTLPAQTQTQPQPQPPQDTVDLRAYLRPIWRRKWLVIAIAVLAGVGTYLVSSHQTNRYVAQTQLYIQTANPTQVVQGQAAAAPSPQTLSDAATQIESAQAAEAAAKALNIPVSASNTVVATPGTNSSFIAITVTSNSPTVAADLANTYVRQYLAAQAAAVVAEAKTLRTESEVTLATLPNTGLYTAQRATVQQLISSYDQIIRNPYPTVGARQYNVAVAPAGPSSPRPKRDAIFGLIVGLVVALALVFILELLDRRLILVSTLESLYSRTVLSVLPHASDPAPTTDGHLSTAPELIEAMRTLLVNIGIEAKERPARSLLITSAMPGEGKSTVSRGLAIAYVEAGKRVLVIDADLRRPIMNATFGLAAAPGLAQVLAGEAALADAVRTVVVSTPSVAAQHSVAAGTNGKPETSSNGNHSEAGVLHVLTHGERVENPATLLSSPAWQAMIDEATSTYDVTIVDSAPILTIADSVPLIDHVDMVLLVTRLGMTTRESAARITALFRRVPGAHLVGLVANDMRDQFLDEGYAYYRYGYGYGQKGDGKRHGIRKYARKYTRV